MKNPLLSWMRVVLPRSDVATVCVAVEMIIEMTYLLVLNWAGQADEIFFRNFRLAWLGMTAFAYGVYRVVAFHPLCNEEYRRWLEATPWTVDKPLPTGPIQQVPQDLIVLSALMLLTRETSLLVCWLSVAYLGGYLTTLAITSRLIGDWTFAYLLGFGLGAIAMAGNSPLTNCVVAMACYPIGFLAIRRSLARFPWDIDWQAMAIKVHTNQVDKYQDRLGWPYDFMSPKQPKVMLPYSDGVCLSLLLGWYAFVAHYHGVPEFRLGVSAISAQVLSIAAINRIWCYVRTHRPPISFWGRIWTGRWIIPGYDVIFVAPLLAEVVLLATQLGAIVLFLANGPFQAAANPTLIWLGIGLSSVGIAATLLILCVMGPVVERWRLSATHRIVFDLTGLGSKQSNSPFVEL